MKNWYQFLTACEKLVPIRHIFCTNSSHFVKNTHDIAYMHIPHIDKIPPPPPSQICCILHSIPILHSFVTDICDDKYQFFTSVKIWYQFFTSLIIWNQFFTCVGIWYQFFTRVRFDTNFSHLMILYHYFFTDVKIWYRFFTRVKSWYRFFIIVKNWY